MSTQVILLFGRPGVGKYTVGQQLAAATGYRLLHNHAVVDLVSALFDFGTPPFVALRERLWLAAVDAALEARIAGLIMTFAPERTVTDDFLPALAARVRRGGGRLGLVELTCAEGTLEGRLEDPSRAHFGKLRDLAFYRQLRADGVFDRPVMPAAELTVDTGTVPPETAAALIAAHLQGAGSRDSLERATS